MEDNFPSESYEGARNPIRDPESKWMQYVNRALDGIDPNVIKQTALNLGFEAAFHGTKTIREMREVHQCNSPWLILMDPTSACNLHCTGCCYILPVLLQHPYRFSGFRYCILCYPYQQPVYPELPNAPADS